MKVEFATCNRHMAERFFEDEVYSPLTSNIKNFILDNLHENVNMGFRVRDPMMYKNASAPVTANTELNEQYLELLKSEGVPFWHPVEKKAYNMPEENSDASA